MAYAPQRNLTGELAQGSIDGTYKQVDTGRGGQVEATTADSRQEFADTWYGIHEADVKHDPFGRPVRTPTYRPTKPVNYPGS